MPGAIVATQRVRVAGDQRAGWKPVPVTDPGWEEARAIEMRLEIQPLA